MRFKKTKHSLTPLKSKMITHVKPQSLISEQYRTLRTNILFSSFDRPLQTMLITSASPSEGKSTTIANLAAVFANQGKKVLLIDADMRKPTIHIMFNLLNAVGLTSVLANQASLFEACMETAIENLFVLPAGPIPPNPAELIGSSSMQNAIKKAKTRFDYILFDSPPVLAVTDSQILADQCDGTILVVNSGKTNAEKGKKAKELLEAASGQLLGAVLNNYNTKEFNYYYAKNS